MTLLYMKRAGRGRPRTIIHETPAAFQSPMVQDFIDSEIARKQWIYKIISGEREQEMIIFRCNEFLVIPDSETTNESGVINWLVIFKDVGLKSMRSLNGKHIPLLIAINDKLKSLVPAHVGTPMIYFHYPPSVWQLHLHVAAPCDILRTTNSMQKVCFLQDVISNLTIDSDYYNKATVTYILPTTHELMTCYKDDGQIA